MEKMLLEDLPTPAFVVDRNAFRQNCIAARAAAIKNGIPRLRPHVKTHKTIEGCIIQAGIDSTDKDSLADVIGFVVSTLPELSMVVKLGCEYKRKPFTDVIFGVPVCKSKLLSIQSMLHELTSATHGEGCIHVLVDNPQQVTFLEEFAQNNTSDENNQRWSVFLKLDTGYHRAGIGTKEAGVELATKIINCTHLVLKGLYTHCGHSYNIQDSKAMKETTNQDHSMILGFLNSLSSHLKSNNNNFDVSSLSISVGSTPSMFSHDNTLKIPNIELHPGNYVFYDRQQLWTGACSSEESIAGFVLARVIGHYDDEHRNAIMVDAGATALTKESTPQGSMCSVLGRPDLECYRMSQEITMIRSKSEDGVKPFPFLEFPLGSTLLLIPNHSCLAAACFEEYHVVDGRTNSVSTKSEVVETWRPVKGW
jgi:D-serine deaminase-like pyridoxal phosphate-dependent protein